MTPAWVGCSGMTPEGLSPDRMNARLPHLSRLAWAVLIIVALLVVWLILSGVIGGRASGGA